MMSLVDIVTKFGKVGDVAVNDSQWQHLGHLAIIYFDVTQVFAQHSLA